MHGLLAIRKAMMMSLTCTRVKAPNLTGGCDSLVYDSVTLKPITGRVEDDALALTPPLEKETKTKKILEKTHKDINPKKPNILSCRSNTFVGTLNVRTARENHKRLELAKTFIDSGLEILGIQEHRVVHQELIKIEQLERGTRLITSSAWRNGAGASTGGVGIVVTRKAYNAISLIKSYGNRVLTVSFDGEPRLTVIIVYSPTEAATEEDAEEFHNTLRQAAADVPAHHLLLVVGDMNARMGKTDSEDCGWYFHDRTNRNGELLRDTTLECGLEASNHRFQKKPGKLWTFLSDGTLTKGQIDYILIRKKWRNSLKNTEAYNFFNSLGSDHRVVVCKLKVSLRKSKNPPRSTRYDFSKLKGDTELQEKYAVTVTNKYSCLMEEMDSDMDHSATEKYSKFVEAVGTANKELLPERPRRKRDDPANDRRVQGSREALFLAKDKYHVSPTEDHRADVAEKKDHLQSCYKVVEEEILRKKIRMVEESADRCRNKESWALVNDVTGKSKANCGLIEGGNGEERLKNWKIHFSKLLGQPPIVPDEDLSINTIHPPLNIKTSLFDKDELLKAKKQIVEGKAFGDDGIPPEVMKRIDLDDIILDFCNTALCDGDIPEHWKHSNIVPVPKKGDLTKADNYRGISLTSIVSKTMNRMILNRIKPSIEQLLRDNQNGFRPGRSTTSHILALRRILEGAKAKNLPAVLTFIDFKKAFDSVHRGILMKILRAYGLPPVIVDLIERMYTGTIAKVITADGLTEAFRILAGVLQGDTLAPYLFVIVIDYIMTTAIDPNQVLGLTITPAKSRRVKAERLADAEFADDVALLNDTIEDAQALLSSLEAAAEAVGLRMNESKTKYMAINIPDSTTAGLKTSSGELLEQVEDFVYLGAWVGSTEHDFIVRKAKAWAACHKMKKIWKSKLRKDLKIRLFQATVESILLYGSETWTITKALEKKIDGCYTRMLRMALDIDWKLHITNKTVYGKLPRVTSKIQERRMKLAGHIQRHSDLIAHHVLLWEPKHGYRGRGRPKITFLDNIRRDTDLTDTGEIKRLMSDRQVWRKSINARTLKPH